MSSCFSFSTEHTSLTVFMSFLQCRTYLLLNSLIILFPLCRHCSFFWQKFHCFTLMIPILHCLIQKCFQPLNITHIRLSFNILVVKLSIKSTIVCIVCSCNWAVCLKCAVVPCTARSATWAALNHQCWHQSCTAGRYGRGSCVVPLV